MALMTGKLFGCSERTKPIEDAEVRKWMKDIETNVQERLEAEMASMKKAFGEMEESFMGQLDQWLEKFETRIRETEDKQNENNKKVDEFQTQVVNKIKAETQQTQMHREHRFRIHALEAKVNHLPLVSDTDSERQFTPRAHLQFSPEELLQKGTPDTKSGDEVTDSARLAALERRVDRVLDDATSWLQFRGEITKRVQSLEERVEARTKLSVDSQFSFSHSDQDNDSPSKSSLVTRLNFLELQIDQVLSSSIAKEPLVEVVPEEFGGAVRQGRMFPGDKLGNCFKSFKTSV